MIRTHEFKVNNATVVVREPKGVDRIDERIVYSKLTYDRSSERDRTRVVNFAEFISRTVSVDGELGFAWATIDSDAPTMQKAFEAWLDWSVDTMDVWNGAMTTVALPPGDSEEQPNADPNG